MKTKQTYIADLKLYWNTMKFSFALPALAYLVLCLLKYHTQPFPSGLSTILDLSWLCYPPQKWVVISALLFSMFLYITEKAMLPNLLFLSILSIAILTLEESNGNTAENGVISLLFIVQFFAYILSSIDPSRKVEKDCIQFSTQIIAAIYVLSAISKLNASGTRWFGADASNFVLEIQRVYEAKFAASGEINYKETSVHITNYLVNHVWLLRSILFSALCVELFSFLMLINAKFKFVFGILLSLLHFGIYAVMDITFPTIMIPMIIITINPFYWIVIFFKRKKSFLPQISKQQF